jgi:hypothetical protein
MDGLGGPIDGLGGPIRGLFFKKNLFDLPRQAPNRLGKCGIYRDGDPEAVGLTASINPFYPPL